MSQSYPAHPTHTFKLNLQNETPKETTMTSSMSLSSPAQCNQPLLTFCCVGLSVKPTLNCYYNGSLTSNQFVLARPCQ